MELSDIKVYDVVFSLHLGSQGTCGSAMHILFRRSDLLTCPVDAPITIEESGCQTYCEGELPTVEELLLGGPVSNQEAGDTLAAEALMGNPSAPAAVGHGDGGGGHNGDARRSAQPSEGEIRAEATIEAAVNSISPINPGEFSGPPKFCSVLL